MGQLEDNKAGFGEAAVGWSPLCEFKEKVFRDTWDEVSRSENFKFVYGNFSHFELLEEVGR